MKLPEEAMLERDAMAWELRKRGYTYEQIGKVLNVSTKTAHRSVNRMGDKVLSRLAVDHVQQAALDLDRIDSMIRSIEAMATGREKMTDANGNEITLPVSLEAQDRMLKLMAQRDKLLGLSGARLDINVNQQPGVQIQSGEQGPKELSNTEATARHETLDLLKLMTKGGVFDEAMVTQILGAMGAADEDFIDVDEIGPGDEEEQLALPAAPTDEPPEWVDVDDSEEWD